MDRTERLLDLVATLLDAPEPVPFARIRELFPDYAGLSAESASRKFERDKAELAELGIPLEFIAQQAEDVPGGYQLRGEHYFLPQLPLRADEWAVLHAAGSSALAGGAFPGSADLAHALRKLSFGRSRESGAPGSAAVAVEGVPLPKESQAVLEGLWSAVKARRRVAFDYRAPGREAVRREVDVYGLVMRRGTWIAVGHCHLRGAMRTFHVARISALVQAGSGKGPDWELPAGFDLERHAAEQPWEHPVHEPVEVLLQLDETLASLAPRLFPHAQIEEGGRSVRLTARCLPPLETLLLQLGERVEVRTPDTLRGRLADRLAALLATLEPVAATEVQP